MAATWQQLHWDWDRDHDHTEEDSMRHWLLHLHRLDHHQMQQVEISLWVIWNERNNELHGEQRKPMFGVVNFVKSYLAEFIQANVQDQEINAQWKPAQQWKPPINLCVKVNFVGALNLQTNKGGFGVVIRI